MLLSYEHRFLFIHVSKAAGTSIQRALTPWAHQPDRLWINRIPGRLGLRAHHVLPYRWRVFREHATALQIKRSLPRRVFGDCYKFAFVRNPWDWLVSLYSYLVQTPSHRHHRMVKAMNFDQYVEFETRRGRRSQHEFVTDRNGGLLVDFVGRFERLHDDFARVCNTLEIEAVLPHSNGSSHRDYRDYYCRRTIELVRRHFQRDVELFEYTFEPRVVVASSAAPEPVAA